MKYKKILIGNLFIAFCMLGSTAFASKLHINNQNTKDIIISIQSEGADNETVHWKELTIPAQKEKDVLVSEEEMGGKKTFCVKGKVNPITPKGTCSNMDITKNYNLTFKDSTLGTECVCELAKD